MVTKPATSADTQKSTKKKSGGKRNDYYGRDTIRDGDEIIVAGFDVETRGLGGELLSIQTGIMGQIEFDCSDSMVSNFYSKFLSFPYPVIWFAHFAQYDWRYLMDHLLVLQERGEIKSFDIRMRNDNDIYEIVVRHEGGKSVMRDSFAIWNSPLSELATSFCPEIPKLEIDIEHFDPTNADHIAYAKRDVLILITGLPRLFAMLKKHFDVNPNGTFASTSVKGWQRSLPTSERYDSRKLDERELFIRQAYYGGIVFLTTTKPQNDCETYDINSSYPYVMSAFGVPYGRCIESADWHDSRMGIYRVKVRAPESVQVPILPARDKRGAMRWYAGTFETICTNRELVFAAQNGYEILELYEGLVWEDIVFPFTTFIESCKLIRKQYKKNRKNPDVPEAEEHLAKFMQNSLYGKFGSRRERRRVFARTPENENECLDATPIDDSGKWWSRKEIDAEMRCLPEWAVFITAHARLRLLQAIYSVGVDNTYYGDTDSITVRAGSAGAIDCGSEYGQFKLEKRWKVFRPIAPKVYTGIRLMDDGTQKHYGAAKGLPRKNLNEGHWKELLEDGATHAEALSLDSLRVSLKSGVKPAEILMRRSSTLENSINFEALSDGSVSLKMAA